MMNFDTQIMFVAQVLAEIWFIYWGDVEVAQHSIKTVMRQLLCKLQ